MTVNLNNSLSIPTSAVLPVQNFSGTPCPNCQDDNLVNAKGKSLKLVACSHLNHEGIPDHVMHSKCLRTWIKHMLNQGQSLPFGFVKCFHCQIALDQTGINNEVLKGKIPKGLFASTLKLVSKVPEKMQQIATALSNSSHEIKTFAITLFIISITGFFTIKAGSVIWNKILYLLNDGSEYTGDIFYSSLNGFIAYIFFTLMTGIISISLLIKLTKNKLTTKEFFKDSLFLLFLTTLILAFGTSPHQQSS